MTVKNILMDESNSKADMVVVAEPSVSEGSLAVNANCVHDGDEVGFPSSPPSFLVHNIDNVNCRYSLAKGLITMWDFLEHKVRIGKTNILLNHKKNISLLKIVPASCKSRYFDDGRWNISRKIIKRLGRFNKVKGLMVTLTFDPKRIGKREAWSSFGRFTRAFLNSVNQYRKRRGWRRLHYLWVVEAQKGTGYPHVHVFFPNLKWLAPMSIIKGNWRGGRTNVESPKQLTTNCAGYISKYLRKMSARSSSCLAKTTRGKPPHCKY